MIKYLKTQDEKVTFVTSGDAIGNNFIFKVTALIKSFSKLEEKKILIYFATFNN